MNTPRQMYYLNAHNRMYPIVPVDNLFLPKFNNFTDINSLGSTMPSVPYQVASQYNPVFTAQLSGYGKHSNLPSRRVNFDSLGIRDFVEDQDSLYALRQIYALRQNNY